MDRNNFNVHKLPIMHLTEDDPANSILAEVTAYWHALRGTRLVPRRSQINPRGIERALPHSFILERIAPGVARFRIAGNRVNGRPGDDLLGSTFTTLFANEIRPQVAALLETVFQTPCTAELRLGTSVTPKDRGRMVLLPLESDLGDVSRILGCVVTTEQNGEAPSQFDDFSASYRPLTGAMDETSPQHPKAPAWQAFCEPPERFRRSGAPKAPRLRLVRTDDTDWA
jgi:hypothetical protein